MELKNIDGRQFWVPAENKDGRINSLKQWDEAFRVYAEIYCKANPTRASEVWQYVDTIHKAAATFTWENVALYDFHFRKMMAKNPHRSWAKTFTQMWNVDLRDHLPKVPQYSSVQKGGSQKVKICWKFNKGHCSYGQKCQFEHRCSFCFGNLPWQS